MQAVPPRCSRIFSLRPLWLVYERVLRASGAGNSVEVEVAKRFFDRRILRLFQPFGELARKDVFLDLLRFDGSAELGFDGIRLLAEKLGRVVKIDTRRLLWRRHVGQHDAKIGVNHQLRLAAGTTDLETILFFPSHSRILRHFLSRGAVTRVIRENISRRKANFM